MTVWLLLLLLLLLPAAANAILCYTCAGSCFSDNQECNCQMNRCEASHCFTEVTLRSGSSTRQSEPSFYLVKGCLRNPPEVAMGCDYKFSRSIVRCVCNDGDFCNQHAALPMAHYTRTYEDWNVSCHSCSRGNGYNCGQSCQGQYCYTELTTGVQQCAFGAPILPFTYRSPQLFASPSHAACVTTETATQLRAECVCNGHACNKVDANTLRYPLHITQTLERANARRLGGARAAGVVDYDMSHVTSDSDSDSSQLYDINGRTMFRCFSCQKVTSSDTILPSDCQDYSQSCVGHFCTLTIETRPMGRTTLKTSSSRSTGCLNTTDPTLLVMGCSQKWEEERYESIECVCRGDYCNSDLHTAHLNRSVRRTDAGRPVLMMVMAMVIMLINTRSCV